MIPFIWIAGAGALAIWSLFEGGDNVPPISVDDLDTDQINTAAFLDTIGRFESGGDYRVLVGGGQFSNFADHPGNLGWSGIARTDGRITTAAGKYQITKSTWNDLGGVGRYGDFSPASQDRAASDLIARRNASAAVESGDVAGAQSLLKNEWESLALRGSDEVLQAFLSFGGYPS